MKVLGIETSCDETGIAIYDTESGLLAESLHSQVDLHKVYGGVVPELASRDHVKRVLPMVKTALSDAGLQKTDLDAIAYTAGPGLIGALLVGASVGRCLAYALDIPALGVHHMEGHLLAPMLEQEPPTYPFTALLVSGGHTQLFAVGGLGSYELLGESLDDAAGEAFDKTAKLLGLDYPGGPQIAKLAEQGHSGAARDYGFPRPMTNRPGLDFSFSGLKTFAKNVIQREKDSSIDNTIAEPVKANIALAFQSAVVDTLTIKCKRALKQSGHQRLIIAGGVSANQALRISLENMCAKVNGRVYYAKPALCTDNGAMIAYAGAQRLLAGQKQGLAIDVKPRWPMQELATLDR